MSKNKFKKDTLGLSGGFIIPPFIIADNNLELEEKYNLAGFLQKHHISQGEFTVSVTICESCGYHIWFEEMVDWLHSMYYIHVNSIEEVEDCLEFRILINPWYLRYIKMNPFYGIYRVDYMTFLKNVIVPELEDPRQREELINTILDSSIDEDSDE